MKIAIFFFTALLVACMLSIIIYMPFVIINAKKKYREECDYLMILGCEIIGEETPGDHLMDRIKTAVSYLEENKKCFVVPCGGCFRPQQKKTEAEIIAKYLIENGIEKKRIICEDKSTTTFENFVFAKKIIENHSGKNISDTKVSFLTSNYHIFRSSIIANCCGLKNLGKVSSATSKNELKSFVREYFVAYDLFYRIITKKYLR